MLKHDIIYVVFSTRDTFLLIWNLNFFKLEALSRLKSWSLLQDKQRFLVICGTPEKGNPFHCSVSHLFHCSLIMQSINQSIMHFFHKYLLNAYHRLGLMLCPSDGLMDNPNYLVSVFEDWPPVLVICFYVTNYPQTQLQTPNSYYLTVSVDQEFRSILAGGVRLRVLHDMKVKMLAEDMVIRRFDWGGDALPRWLAQMAVSRVRQFLATWATP